MSEPEKCARPGCGRESAIDIHYGCSLCVYREPCDRDLCHPFLAPTPEPVSEMCGALRTSDGTFCILGEDHDDCVFGALPTPASEQGGLSDRLRLYAEIAEEPEESDLYAAASTIAALREELERVTAGAIAIVERDRVRTEQVLSLAAILGVDTFDEVGQALSALTAENARLSAEVESQRTAIRFAVDRAADTYRSPDNRYSHGRADLADEILPTLRAELERGK